jgi:hypothetical protein
MVGTRLLGALPFLALAAIAAPALADPCEAPVNRFRAGQTFAGEVRYVGDGDSICIGLGPSPATWIEVRLADWFAPELHEPGGALAKATMVRIALGQRAVCTVERGRNGRTYTFDRVVAVCRVRRDSLAVLMRQAGIPEGGRGR